MNIEHAAGVDVDPGGLGEEGGQLVLVVLLHLHHLPLQGDHVNSRWAR